MRWSQWSMFQSHVRLHGTEPQRVPWLFGERAEANFRRPTPNCATGCCPTSMHTPTWPPDGAAPHASDGAGVSQMTRITHDWMTSTCSATPSSWRLSTRRRTGVPSICRPGNWYDYWTGAEPIRPGDAARQAGPRGAAALCALRLDHPHGAGHVLCRRNVSLTRSRWISGWTTTAECTLFDDSEGQTEARAVPRPAPSSADHAGGECIREALRGQVQPCGPAVSASILDGVRGAAGRPI